MSFTVLDLVGACEQVNGRLQRRMLELRPGLFVGNLPVKIRDEIWMMILEDRAILSGIMIYPSRQEGGYALRSMGARRREPVEHDGVWLMRYRRHFTHPE